MMQTVLLGFSQADITPEAPVQTVGFGRADELSRGVLSPLLVQAAVWRLGDEKCCLMAIDHIGLSREHASLLRQDAAVLLGVGRQNVMLCFSHTHSAPNDSAEEGYFALMRGRAALAVRAAAEGMSPVNIAWGNAAADIGVNRRGGALDRRIGVMKACDAKTGETHLLLLRLTAHANSLKADNYLISPDYFGAARELLSKEFRCPVMLTQGASGDIAPKYYRSSIDPPDVDASGRFIRSPGAMEDMAREILRQTGDLISGLSPSPAKRLAMYSVRKRLRAEVPQYSRALEIARDAARYAGIDGSAWLSEVLRLNDAGVRHQYDDVEIQYFALGGGCLCGVANEIMCPFALRAQERLGPLFYLGGYTNGCAGYFPTEEEFDLGGYEVYWSMLIYYIYYGRVFPYERESASALIDAAVRGAPASSAGEAT